MLDEAGVVTVMDVPFSAGASYIVTTNREGMISFLRNHIDTAGSSRRASVGDRSSFLEHPVTAEGKPGVAFARRE
jgi:hypothetical protein